MEEQKVEQVLVSVDVNDILAKKRAELEQVKKQIDAIVQKQEEIKKQAEQQIVNLQKVRDQYLTKGIELQGIIRQFEDLLPKEESKAEENK